MKRIWYQNQSVCTVKAGGNMYSVMWGQAIPLGQVNVSANETISRLFGADGMGSPLLVRDSLREERHAYTVYGYDARLAEGTVLGFNGQLSCLLKHTYSLGNGHRIYSTSLMRFLAPDRLSPFKEGGVNAYGYVQGDPVNRDDPTGQMFRRMIGRQRVKQKVKPLPAVDVENPIDTPAIPSNVLPSITYVNEVASRQPRPSLLSLLKQNSPATDNLLGRLDNKEMMQLGRTSRTAADAVSLNFSRSHATLEQVVIANQLALNETTRFYAGLAAQIRMNRNTPDSPMNPVQATEHIRLNIV